MSILEQSLSLTAEAIPSPHMCLIHKEEDDKPSLLHQEEAYHNIIHVQQQHIANNNSQEMFTCVNQQHSTTINDALQKGLQIHRDATNTHTMNGCDIKLLKIVESLIMYLHAEKSNFQFIAHENGGDYQQQQQQLMSTPYALIQQWSTGTNMNMHDPHLSALLTTPSILQHVTDYPKYDMSAQRPVNVVHSLHAASLAVLTANMPPSVRTTDLTPSAVTPELSFGSSVTASSANISKSPSPSPPPTCSTTTPCSASTANKRKNSPNNFDTPTCSIPHQACQLSHITKKKKVKPLEFKQHKLEPKQEGNKRSENCDTTQIHASSSLSRSTKYLSLESHQDIPDDVIYDQPSLGLVLKLSIPQENNHIRFQVKTDVLCMSEQNLVDKSSSHANTSCRQQVVKLQKQIHTATILREQWNRNTYYFLKIPYLKLGLSTNKERGKLKLRFTYFSTSISDKYGDDNCQIISQIETNEFTTLSSKAASKRVQKKL
ncbi:hypothetical protein C9374_005252 [Naegleria lovaniensis]|uniref:Uncharacterized protein n=1 Tax=Naegleria lovaniensis TaxID=51637 RepID=A0AA88GQW4_NAELO|nr:uncharacterized protein C9374_005252 [Naegleria lovaniensis]KAG2382672.1 hypothetical protein C9374_005252 [Naegleria lovaniensis]